MYIVGVDPGLAGAIAVLDAHGTLAGSRGYAHAHTEGATRYAPSVRCTRYGCAPAVVCRLPVPGVHRGIATDARPGDALDVHHRVRLRAVDRTADHVPSVLRYETALERSLYQALHELQRLQAARAGVPVPPPAAADVDVTVMAPREEEGAGSWLCFPRSRGYGRRP